MPDDARITAAWVKRERFGGKYRHWLYVAFERERPVGHAVRRTVGVDINMRSVQDGIRVAVTYDGSAFREWVLPQDIADKAYHAHETQSTRDHNFNEAKA